MGGTNVWAMLSPSKTLALSFIGMISFGAFLLIFPAATTDGQGATITDAFFTMASATSVTGLIVQNTGTYFSTFGLLVILVIMQTGAIGIMVLAGAFAVLIGGRLSNSQQAGFEEAGFAEIVDVTTVDGLKRLVYSVTLATFLIEIIGTIILYVMWLLEMMPLRAEFDAPLQALWWCFFHSVSAFCHAGFSLESDSLVQWVSNPWVNAVFMVLITFGAVGFPVLVDLAPRKNGFNLLLHPKRMWKKFHIQTKVVLIVTALLNVIGMLFYLYFEFDASLKKLGLVDKVIAALFQSVTLRSAGFNTVAISDITPPTVVFCVVLMFIGSAPASTGGGVRITTMAVVTMAIRTMLLGREDVELFGRRLAQTLVYRAISIVLVAGIVVSVAFTAVVASQDFGFQELLFETVSAFGTVGLSMGITGDLDNTGKWIMTFLMYFGRVGPITLALAIGERLTLRDFRYPEGRLAVG